MKAKLPFLFAFEALDMNVSVDSKIVVGLKQFVCSVYNKTIYSDVNKFQFNIVCQRFHTESGNILSNSIWIDFRFSLLPCQFTLKLHRELCVWIIRRLFDRNPIISHFQNTTSWGSWLAYCCRWRTRLQLRSRWHCSKRFSGNYVDYSVIL